MVRSQKQEVFEQFQLVPDVWETVGGANSASQPLRFLVFGSFRSKKTANVELR